MDSAAASREIVAIRKRLRDIGAARPSGVDRPLKEGSQPSAEEKALRERLAELQYSFSHSDLDITRELEAVPNRTPRQPVL